MNPHPISVRLYFTNIGKRPAKQGTATLFPFNEAHTRGQPFGKEEVIVKVAGGSNVVLPQSTAEVTFNI
jgi:hypothetical protein